MNQLTDIEVGSMWLQMGECQHSLHSSLSWWTIGKVVFGCLRLPVAVATSDTWASEIGCLDQRVRMITTLKPCEAGVNGGFSPNGQLAAVAGGLLIGASALVASLVMFSAPVSDQIVIAGIVAGLGFLGCQIDSILGAVLENRGFLTKGSVNALSIIAGVALMWLYLGRPM